MSKKVSILSRIKNFFGMYDDTSVSNILTDNRTEQVEDSYEIKEFEKYDHYYIFEVLLPDDEIVIPDGYELVGYVDRVGYRIDDIEGYEGQLFVECANSVPVVARTTRFKPPYGFNGYKYAGKPIKNVVGSIKR